VTLAAAAVAAVAAAAAADAVAAADPVGRQVSLFPVVTGAVLFFGRNERRVILAPLKHGRKLKFFLPSTAETTM